MSKREGEGEDSGDVRGMETVHRWNGRNAVLTLSPEQRTVMRAILSETGMSVDDVLQRMWMFAVERGFLETLEYHGATTMLGEAVRSCRRKMKWTKVALGQALGVSVRIVREVEQGHMPHPTTVSGLAAWMQLPYIYCVRAAKYPWPTGLPLPEWVFGGVTPLPLGRGALTFSHVGSKFGRNARAGKPWTLVSYGETVYEFDTKEAALRKAASMVEPCVIVHRRWGEEVGAGIDAASNAGWKAWLHKKDGPAPPEARAVARHPAAASSADAVEIGPLGGPMEGEDVMVPGARVYAGEPEEEGADPLSGWRDDDDFIPVEESDYMSDVVRHEDGMGPGVLLPSDDDILPSIEDLASGKPLVPPPNLTPYAAQFWKPLSEKEKEEAKRWRDSLP